MSHYPDFRVAALNKTTNEKSNIGAAWTNEDGTISIVLSSFIVIHAEKALLITLFPNGGKAT